MRKIFIAALIGSTIMAGAAFAQGTGYQVIPKASQTLKPGPGNLYQQFNLLNHKNAQALVTTRDRSGMSEHHKDWEDHIFIMDGEATMELGGTMVKPKETGPGETRGEGIDGAKSFTVHAGDYVYIPVNTPHRMILAPGKTIRYAVVKVHS